MIIIIIMKLMARLTIKIKVIVFFKIIRVDQVEKKHLPKRGTGNTSLM